jgi:hypothetical protein
MSDEAALRWFEKNPAFTGTLDLSITITVLDKATVRKARFEYEYTPEWEYFDLKKQALYVGWGYSSMRLLMLTAPEEGLAERGGSTDEKPEWLLSDLSRMLSMDTWEAIEDLLEERVTAEDAARRKAAGILPH